VLLKPFTKFQIRIFAIGLLVFAIGAALYLGGERYPNLGATYRSILTFWGVDVTFKSYVPFVDLHFVLAALQCRRLGIDIFVANPCDILGRQFIYSPMWMVASPIGLSTHDTAWLGIILGVAFLFCVAWTSNARNGAQAAFYLAALLSQPCVFAIERGNADIAIFIVVVGACAAYQYHSVGRTCTYGALLLASLLKFYPIAALGLAVHERKQRLALVVVATIVIWAIFLVIVWDELLELWPELSRPVGPYGEVFGGINVFHDFQIRLARLFPSQASMIAHILYALAIVAAILISAVVARRLRTLGVGNSKMDRDLALFWTGGLIIVFSFFAYVNLYYRGIFLLALLPFMVRSWQTAVDPRVKRTWIIGICLIIFLLWIPLVHYNLGHNLGHFRLARILAMAVREPLWWLFITWLISILWVQLSYTPFVGTVMRQMESKRLPRS
jgi:hypothetical protein